MLGTVLHVTSLVLTVLTFVSQTGCVNQLWAAHYYTDHGRVLMLSPDVHILLLLDALRLRPRASLL